MRDFVTNVNAGLARGPEEIGAFPSEIGETAHIPYASLHERAFQLGGFARRARPMSSFASSRSEGVRSCHLFEGLGSQGLRFRG